MKIIILIPIYNDWQSATKLLENINNEVSGIDHTFSITLVNDASTEQITESLPNFSNLNSVQILNLKQNVGHARCIATGLNHIIKNEEFDYVIPMDGDGEDRPEEIKLFIENFNYHPNKTIVGERVKRSESILFKLCYSFHKILTYTFTGQSIKFGNYTCLPKLVVEQMLRDASTWSSFSGSLAKLTRNRTSIPSIRGSRYFGPSKMSFSNLIKHSLSIVAVFKQTVIIRSIIFLLVYLFFTYQSLSIITLIPVFFTIFLIYSVITLSYRENITELNNSLENIISVEKIK